MNYFVGEIVYHITLFQNGAKRKIKKKLYYQIYL